MEWKHKLKDQDCAEELEEQMLDEIKAGFLSNQELAEQCREYMEDNYPEECDEFTQKDLLEVIQTLRIEVQNTGNQENFQKLDAVFASLRAQDIITKHYAGYTQFDGFADCNEDAAWLEEQGIQMIGCCFYTEQDLGHLLHEDTTSLFFSFGNYQEKPTAEEVGRIIADTFTAAGFCVQWDGTADTKLAIQNFRWDKYYSDEA